MKFRYLILLLILIVISCSSEEDKELRQVLSLAGSNRSELEKVLDHYSHCLSDSQKYNAAKYLILNMKGHYSSERLEKIPDLIKSSFEHLHSLTLTTYFQNKKAPSFLFLDTLQKLYSPDYYTISPGFIDSTIWHKNLSKYFPNPEVGKTEKFEKVVTNIGNKLLKDITFIKSIPSIESDLNNITASFLINHIDNAFKVWRKSPFVRTLNYNEFAETILPYRYGNEPLDTLTEFCYTHFFNIVHSPDSLNINEIVRRFNFYTYCMDCFENGGKQLGNFGIYDILQFYQFECNRHSEWTCKVLNACGIPTFYNFTPSWKNRDRSHFWVSVRDTSGKFLPFTPKWQLLNDSIYFDKTSKVYQITFKSQDNCPQLIKGKDEQVPEVFRSEFIKDVTNEYHKVTDLSIPIDGNIGVRRLGYLGIFTTNGWKPVAWGKINLIKGMLDFKDIPVSTMYIAGLFENDKFNPVGSPFYINSNKKLENVKPDCKTRINLILTRKYPKKIEMIERMKKMCGAKIQGANKLDFSDKVDLHILTEKDISDFVIRAIKINNKGNFRYIRCVPTKGNMVNIALMEAYSKVKQGDPIEVGSLPFILSPDEKRLPTENNLSKLIGQPLGSDTTLIHITDHNMETFFKGFSAILDFGKSVEISQIRFAPRNANNSITVGDRYELLYYDVDWKSAGIQKAEYNYLEYKDVPSNTIYWLHNLDRGKEELAFIYRDGKQIFVNHDYLTSIYK